MNIEYGVATLEDLPRIVDRKVGMFKEAGHADLFNDRAGSIVLRDYQQLYLESTAIHFVARDKGQIVASVGAFIKSDLPFRYFFSRDLRIHRRRVHGKRLSRPRDINHAE